MKRGNIFFITVRDISRLMRKKNMSEGGKGVQNSSPLKTRDVVSEQFGISHDTMTKEIAIVDHKDLILPEDF